MNLTKSKVLFLIIIPLFLYILALPMMPLIEPDEARYSDIPSIMNQTGNYITPHLNDVVYLEKPPLGYWATAFFFKILGESEFSSRLFAALCAWGCIFLVYLIGKFFHGEKTGLYSAGILSTFLFHSFLGRINILDMPLTFFTSLAIWGGYRYFAEGCFKKKYWLYLTYFASALAFLTKGLIGMVFPFSTITLWLLISKRWCDVPKLLSPFGIIIFLAVSCPWIIFVQKANKDFLWFFFIHEHFLRYTTTLHRRHQSLFFYFPIVILGTLPWSAFLWKAIREGGKKAVPLFNAKDRNFLMIWILFIFIFFSLSSTQLIPYIAPIFLPIAVMMGRFFRVSVDQMNDQGTREEGSLLYKLPVLLQSSLCILLLILLPFSSYLKWNIFVVHSEFEKWWLVILPILSQVLLVFLPDIIQKRLKKGWFLTIYLLSALFLGSMIFPIAHFLTPYKSAYPISQAISQYLPNNQELYQFRICLYGIHFYNKIRTPLVGALGELRFGLLRLPPEERSRFYLSPEDLFRTCKEKGEIYCVTRYRANVEYLRERVSDIEILWDNKEFFLLKLKC